MKSNAEIRQQARQAFANQRGTAILLSFVLILSSWASTILDLIVAFLLGQGVVYWIVYTAGLFVIYVMGINLLGEYVKIWTGKPASVSALFTELKVNFLRKLGGLLWQMLWISLWSLLFIIPGMIKSLSYFFTPNILADCPNVTATEALKISMRITRGYKWRIFLFVLSFFGWFLLSALTLGILGIVYVLPYFYTADAGLYLELREDALNNGRITYKDLGMEADLGIMKG